MTLHDESGGGGGVQANALEPMLLHETAALHCMMRARGWFKQMLLGLCFCTTLHDETGGLIIKCFCSYAFV